MAFITFITFMEAFIKAFIMEFAAFIMAFTMLEKDSFMVTIIMAKIIVIIIKAFNYSSYLYIIASTLAFIVNITPFLFIFKLLRCFYYILF